LIETEIAPAMLAREQVIAEAARCLMCNQPPCERACPAGVGVATFARRLRFGDFGAALRKILDANVLAGTCGMTCPEGMLCEDACVLRAEGKPIRIRDLQLGAHLYGADHLPLGRVGPLPGSHPPKVAVIGGGPAGVACGHHLMRLGVDTVLYESRDALGGMLARGIPAYRLARDVVEREIAWACRGIDVVTNAPVERLTHAGLTERGYAAVFLATGLWESGPAGLEGSDLEGVVDGQRLLEQFARSPSNLPNIRGRVAVIGGGNTACDVASCIVHYTDAEAMIFYRRTRDDMPAFAHEVAEALASGVRFEFLTAPVAARGGAKVTELVLRRMRAGETDASGRRAPVPIEGSEFSVKCDHVVLATGARLAAEWLERGFGLVAGANGRVAVSPATLATTTEGVFAGGDLVREKGLVVQAVSDGRRAACGIAQHLGVIA
jgi:NADPH-dependent glutamate synthase beta subunit-like oxidoreductase